MKKFKQVIIEFHLGFLIGNFCGFFAWLGLQKYTGNSVEVYPYYYISVALSYIGLWIQLLFVYILKYRKSN